MEKRVQHRLKERFPERADAIKSLSETNAKFKNLIADHHDASEALSSKPPPAIAERQRPDQPQCRNSRSSFNSL